MFVAFDAPATGTVASAETDNPSVEAVAAKIIQCAAINCPLTPITNLLQQRYLIIERIDPDDNVLATVSYAVPAKGGRDRDLTFQVDVAIFPKARVRARFDDCAAGEQQWVVINYEHRMI